MADTRFQVFISSTYQDLKDERHQVMQALLELDCIPAGMELFPASDDDQWTLIRKVIDDSDYYLVIVGGRYGSKDADGVSYTEREYDYAVETGKPVMAFLHQDPMNLKAVDVELDTDAQEKLIAFRAKVEQRMCRYWSSAEELGGIVSRSYVKLLKSHPATGWVRASEALTPEMLVELNALRQRVAELEQELAQSAPKAPPSAWSLAQGNDNFGVEITLDDRIPGDWRTKKQPYRVNLSWDSIFKSIGPSMLGGEATEAQLRSHLATTAHSTAAARDPGAKKMSSPSLLNFEPIKVQLVALGLLQRGSQKRTPSDRNTYWKLTPYGEHHLMTLSAIRRADGFPTTAASKESDDGR